MDANFTNNSLLGPIFSVQAKLSDMEDDFKYINIIQFTFCYIFGVLFLLIFFYSVIKFMNYLIPRENRSLKRKSSKPKSRGFRDRTNPLGMSPITTPPTVPNLCSLNV